MFGRIKFDNLIGSSLANAGLSSKESLDFWPVGRTTVWFKEGKKMSWPPHESAMRSLFALVIEYQDNDDISEDVAHHLMTMCLETGKALNVQSETIAELSEVLDNLYGN